MQAIPIISGTNRNGSKTLKMAQYYKRMLESKGIDSFIIDLRDLPVDFQVSAMFENRNKNEAFNKLSSKLEEAHKFVVVTPEYNCSIPGVLKSFIDGCRIAETFLGKTVALVGIADGMQGGNIAINHLTDIFNYVGADVIATKAKIAFAKEYFIEGEVIHEPYKKVLSLQMDRLIASEPWITLKSAAIGRL